MKMIEMQRLGARMCRLKLWEIDKLLDEIERVDPYGDIVQNFEDECRERHTKRLIEMITKDLK
jgi:hypothetical protein